MSLYLLGSLIDEKDINEKVYILEGKKCNGKSVYKNCNNRIMREYSGGLSRE
uniref:Uncharacterized protein n=1 Tax=viral metagenome TaxID=1070528 RepID=A0A6C0BLR2_9ZZZZ